MNSAYNVGQAQSRRLKEELFRAEELIDLIADGEASWTDLLERNTFFREHQHFLEVSICVTFFLLWI